MSLLADTYPDDKERSKAMGLALSGIALGVLSKCKCSNIYRTQRSCGKVMLLHLSVSHSVHGGVYPSMHLGRVCVSQHVLGQRGVYIPECTWAGDACPGGSLPGDVCLGMGMGVGLVSTQWGVCTVGCLCRG